MKVVVNLKLKKQTTKTKKNYLILGAIYLVVILLVLYLASWYRTYQEYQKETPVLRNTISEITPEEVEHYLLENPSSILYMCTSNNEECRLFETDLKKIIMKNEWQDQITYINLSDEMEDRDGYLNQLVTTYGTSGMTISRLPTLLAFEEGKLSAVEAGLNGAPMTVSEAEKFIDIHQTGQ